MIVRLSSLLPASSLVLDLGCGTGLQTRALATRGLRVVGLDADDDAVETARGFPPGTEASLGRDIRPTFHPVYVVGRGERLPFEDESFDAVLCRDVFHWSDDETVFLRLWREAWRVLRVGGLLQIRTLWREALPDAVPVSSMEPGRFRLTSGATWFLPSHARIEERLVSCGGEWVDLPQSDGGVDEGAVRFVIRKG